MKPTKCKYENMLLPEHLCKILNRPDVNVIIPNSREEIMNLALGGNKDVYDISYDINGKEERVATVTKCKNGIVVNYDDPYMRRRDPHSMVIGDLQPTDKPTYTERFGETFDKTRQETFEWFESLSELILIPFLAGNGDQGLGYDALLIIPSNAAFFGAALADLQGFITHDSIPEGFDPRAIVYVAPPFKDTHFDGKQIVVHNRLNNMHEVFSYNLYPGPSAKKGIYGVLISIGESEGWVTLHASAVTIVTPYENQFTIMHEGASGGGKSEMLEHYHRASNGQLLFATNTIDGEKYYLNMSDESTLIPITDDMAMAHPSVQNNSRKLVISDAEDGWFLRVDHITKYGTEPGIEKKSIHPKKPLVMFNIDCKPNTTALIWEPIMDTPDKPCSNPRIIMPRSFLDECVDKPAEVDVRSFGLRQPPSTKENPNYGIAGIFHVLPPALAWLWRLVAPRGYANPSIVGAEGMVSEGVGSYWPFATGKKVDQANLLLEQILHTPSTRYALIPNQYIGAYKVGFSGEWVSREYMSRRGSLKFGEGKLAESRCPLLGYVPNQIKVDGIEIRRQFLQTNFQPELGNEGYDIGAKMLADFFKKEVKQYQTSNLHPLGKKIIDCCLNDGSLQDYFDLIPKL